MPEGFDFVGSKDAAVDAPSQHDWSHDMVFGAEENPVVKADVILDRTPLQDQMLDVSTHMACTIFGMAHCANEGNAIEADESGVPTDVMPITLAKDVVPGAVEAGWFNPSVGATLQDAMKHFRAPMNLISGYSQCATFDQVVFAIGARSNPVFTGTNRADWAKTRETGEFVSSPSSYGHAVAVLGYHLEIGEDGKGVPEKDYLVVRNSWGAKWGPFNGTFRVFRKDFGFLFTCYEIFDQSDAPKVEAYRAKLSVMRRAYAKSAGIWNGERENDPVTRGEAAEMAVKSSAYHVAKFNEYVAANR
jgi:hypothetical protein